MANKLIYPAGGTPACQYAAEILYKEGIPIVDHPTPEVTHLLLDVPSFDPEDNLRGGGDVMQLLQMLPPEIAVIGGNLQHPALEGYQVLDFLRDEPFLARNAAITAHCALKAAGERMTAIFADTPILIIGWGRIGKCLARLLRALDARVTVAARKETDRACLESLGYRTAEPSSLKNTAPSWRVVFNTAPEPVVDAKTLALWKNCLKIELASRSGLEGQDVVIARGLPGRYAPESSGELIARSVIRKLKEEIS